MHQGPPGKPWKLGQRLGAWNLTLAGDSSLLVIFRGCVAQHRLLATNPSKAKQFLAQVVRSTCCMVEVVEEPQEAVVTPERMRELIKAELGDEDAEVSVFDNCDQVRRKCNKFLASGLSTKTAWLKTMGVAPGSFNTFMNFNGKGSGAGNGTYVKAYCFFEKQRVLEKKAKTKARKTNEARWPTGYRLKHDNGKRLCFGGRPTDRSIFDIDACQDRRNASGW